MLELNEILIKDVEIIKCFFVFYEFILNLVKIY